MAFDAVNPETSPSDRRIISAGIDVTDGRPTLHVDAEGFVERRVDDIVAVAHMKPELIEKVLARELGLIRSEVDRGDLKVPMEQDQTPEDAIKEYLLSQFDIRAREAYRILVAANETNQQIINDLLKLVGDDPEKIRQAMDIIRTRPDVESSVDVLSERATPPEDNIAVKPITPMGLIAVKAFAAVTGALKATNHKHKNPAA